MFPTRPSRKGSVRLGALLFMVLAAGCSAAASDSDGSESGIISKPLDELAELDSVLGDDRVAKILHAAPDNVPFRYDAFETTFGVGRSCARNDSKEVWTIEEQQNRLGGSQHETPDFTPRFVIGGCNKNPSTPNSMRATFEMLIAMVSDPQITQTSTDPVPVAPVEIMALDNTTGLYNFYVLEPSPDPTATGTVTRFTRTANDVIEKWQKIPGKPATKAVSEDRKCYSCHVHGGPVMNELTEPWTNWLSSHKTYSRPEMTGLTRALVSESRPFSGEHGRSSLANGLEQITRAAIATWVEGTPGVPNSGLGPQILAGKQPGGAGALLKSVFCETEVNYSAMFNTVPMSLFIDKTLGDFAAIEPPIPPVTQDLLTLLPVRSETDLRIERFLQKTKIIRPDTVLAVRVFDDMHEIFSAKRCALHAVVTARLPAVGSAASVDDAVRVTILESLAADEAARATSGHPDTSAPQRAFIKVLLDPAADPAIRDAAEAAYISDLSARFATEAAKLETDEGTKELQARWFARQAAARNLFPTAATPLPLTKPPVP